ncbi:DUF427 domain-containing protein [Actinopolymorpha alba]|uniref:DUF427 domain-containing protein n=1 Tax=Actinopolymorpha alba TaxID=533267 RepID=UPI0003798CB6|nr:DUF427 domain-containing protein [Actinopolymorpha alba]
MVTNRGRIRIEPGAKRIRTYLGGVAVADSTHPVLVWESPYYPTYYLPVQDVRMDLIEPDGNVVHSPSRGDGHTYTVKAGGKEAAGAALRYESPAVEELRDLVRFDWAAMDAWFEEDEEVFVHARNPYTRVDILASSRHVRVEVDGVTVADSSSPTLLFETGAPVRYYLPKSHVRMDLLTPTTTETRCPYKGQAEYWSVRVGDEIHDDLAWSYPTPFAESQKITGLISFYNEKVDIYVDGVREERPSR